MIYWVGGYHIEVPGVAAFIGFVAEAKRTRIESVGASTLHTPSLLVLIQMTRRERKG